MVTQDLNVVLVLMTVARERSFTRAAAQLGMSQSAVSRTVRSLEEKMGILLLTRTTRSVAPTEAGQRLLTSWNVVLTSAFGLAIKLRKT